MKSRIPSAGYVVLAVGSFIVGVVSAIMTVLAIVNKDWLSASWGGLFSVWMAVNFGECALKAAWYWPESRPEE